MEVYLDVVSSNILEHGFVDYIYAQWITSNFIDFNSSLVSFMLGENNRKEKVLFCIRPYNVITLSFINTFL